ncbi:hypothetical protein PISL3812_07835 [Talaromyces islandicus]|uniref:Jacalin-type lectin domain-containing protein n=1 Tax=Talaromyces islandicus TaxID=28573 RepID=A0A0U1M6Z1_TALIS|nr:hypothetical protein PISL3812_07835 [Talaromyces islandicus]
MSHIIKNKVYPGSGGDDFEEYEFPQLQGVDAWYGFPGGVQDLRGLQLRYNTSAPHRHGTTDGSPDASYDFKDGEKVTAMDIWGTEESVSGISGGFVTGIEFNTTHRQNILLGDNSGSSKPEHQTVGNGVCIGFSGRSGSDIDALGAVFTD